MKKLTELEKATLEMRKNSERCAELYKHPAVRKWMRACERQRILVARWNELRKEIK